MSVENAFRALGDPTRRDIVRMLAARDMTIGEVAARFAMTRAAVKKHLVVLERGELIEVRPRGRERVNRLRPEALHAARAWLDALDRFWDARLAGLQHAIDEERDTAMSDVITKTAFFRATPETVWSFLTDREKLGRWYHPARADLVAGAAYELFDRERPDADGPIIWGRVLEADRPRKLVQTFVLPMFDGAETVVTWTLETVAGGTRLTLRHEGVAEAASDAPLPLLEALDKGWDEHLAGLRDAVVGG